MKDAIAETQELFSRWKKSRYLEAVYSVNGVRQLINKCDSILEQSFLLTYLLEYGPDVVWEGPNNPAFAIERIPCGAVRLDVQKTLTFPDLTCRPDFIFTCHSILSAEIRARLIVEIDGHNFHERTKEQAQRDKYRDRILTREGFRIFRFTGSEVFKDVSAAVSTVSEFFWKLDAELAA